MMKDGLSKKDKNFLDSLNDDELFLLVQLKYGMFIPIWKEVTKEEYEANYGKEDDYSFDNITKWIKSTDTYKRKPHWNKDGILWQIEHKPDYYTYHKLVGREIGLMLGSNIMEYLNDRKPEWFKRYLNIKNKKEMKNE